MQDSSKKITDDVADLDSGKIPPMVAVSSKIDDFENKKVVLSFEQYNQRQCGLAKIAKTEAKHLTAELKKISETAAKHFRHEQISRIACKPVYGSGNYAPLFNGLPEDAELLEVNYTKAGRVFGYMVQNVFNVVAVAKEHLK